MQITFLYETDKFKYQVGLLLEKFIRLVELQRHNGTVKRIWFENNMQSCHKPYINYININLRRTFNGIFDPNR